MEHLSIQDVRAIFFDAVCTLIHPDPPAPEVYAAVGRRFGSILSLKIIQTRFKNACRREEEADRANGLRTGEVHEHNRWRRIVAQVLSDVHDEACFAELFAHFGRPESWRCDPQAETVLRDLAKRGFLLGMASNFDSRLRPVVDGLAELRQLRHLIISSEVGWRKPAPEFFEAMARMVELPPAKILYIGDDRANDYEGAREAGMRAVLYDAQDSRPTDRIDRVRRLDELISHRP
jgi:putative hydrolase of the HAD superfamily